MQTEVKRCNGKSTLFKTHPRFRATARKDVHVSVCKSNCLCFEIIPPAIPASKNQIERSTRCFASRVFFFFFLLPYLLVFGFHLVLSLRFISARVLQYHTPYVHCLSLSLSRILAVSSSINDRSIFFTPTFFSPADTVSSSLAIRLISPAFPATPHFPRNRSIFFPSPRFFPSQRCP